MSTPESKPITESKEAVFQELLEAWREVIARRNFDDVSLDNQQRDWLRRYREAS